MYERSRDLERGEIERRGERDRERSASGWMFSDAGGGVRDRVRDRPLEADLEDMVWA